MALPFTMLYTKPLKAVITSDNEQLVLLYIQKVILEKKAKNVVVEGMQVSYKGTAFAPRGALFGSVDCGTFTLITEANKSYLTYGFKMYHLFIITGAIAVIAFAVSRLWLVGVGSFLWLGGMNWLINLARHEGLISQLAFDIDKLLGVKEEEVKGEEYNADREKLKSWM